MADFKDQIEKAETDNVVKLVADLRAIAAKGQAGEADVTADAIREQIVKTQEASLGLFAKVRSGPTLHHPRPS
jgi:molecular chaperone DnaK